MPRISVIIPAYNEEKLIQRCIQAIASQKYPREQFEIIVVDNLSTDQTKQKAQEAGADKVLDFAEKIGVGSVRNAAVSQAQGEVLAFVDSDSYPNPNWLAQMDAHFQNPQVAVVGGRAVPDEHRPAQRFMFWLYDYFLRAHQLIGKVLPWGFNLAVRKQSYLDIGGFNPKMRTSEDWELAMRMQKKFGRNAGVYDSKAIVYTSIRKQASLGVFLKYLWDGTKNYCNVVVLRRIDSATAMFDVR